VRRLGSGIGTLLNGGSIKDALKSALISGAVGGVTAGFTGSGSFTQNISDAASGFGARVGQTVSGAGSTFTGGGFTGEGNLFSDYVPTPGAEVASAAESATSLTTQPIQQGDTLSQIAQANNTSVDALMAANPQITDPNMIIAGESLNIPPVSAGGTSLSESVVKNVGEDVASAAAEETAERSFLEKTGDYMFRGGQSPEANSERCRR